MSTFTLQDLTPKTIIEPTTTDILNNFAIPQVPQDAPEPQPTFETPVPNLEQIINTICTQLQLLTTVIKGERAQGNSLQECVSLTLQQAEWFKEMVENQVDKYDFNEIVSESTHDRICSEVEEYFNYRFDPTDHFDMNDAVAEEVDNRLDDVVRDRLDDVVKEQLEELVAEKLSNIRISFD